MLRCPVAAWTSWTPAVLDGQCKEQTQYQDKLPQTTYVYQQNDCRGIIPDCHPMRLTNKRTFCRCHYKDCVQGPWTSWEIHSWTGNCPSERRLKPYRSITRYKDAYSNCIGIGPQKCPTPPGEVREKEVTCPALPVPENGKHLDAACQGVNSRCDSYCRMECKAGYNLVGNKYVTCHGSEKWDQPQGRCKDIEPPIIQCPSIKQYFNDPNKNYAEIDLSKATATDNSGLAIKITVSHQSPLKVYVRQPVKVTYTATDAAGNKKSCHRTYTVKDHEAPKVMSCPDKYRLIQTGQFPHQVFWSEPTFHDNVDPTNELTVIPSNDNGSRFPQGTYVITVTARDKSLNTANCTFTIELQRVKCPVPLPPKHGSAQCNIKKDGVKEAFVCTVSCKTDSWFLQGENIPKLYNFYVCSEGGDWGGTPIYDVFNPQGITQLPADRPIWPDCSVGLSPDGAEFDMHVFGGTCSDQSTMEKLKKDFLDTLKKDLIFNYLFCGTSTNNCDIENIVVYCSKRKRRNADGTQSSQLVIKFAFAVRNKGLASKSSADFSKLNALSSDLEKQKATIIQKVQAAAPRILKDYTASVSALKVTISCEPGYEFKIMSGSNNIKCLKCPRGMYFNSGTRKCTVCQEGTYQNTEGSLSCKKCPVGKTTAGKLKTDFHECKEICQAGTYSKDGLETCFACPLATYQPLSQSTSCIACPNGKVTNEVGSTQLTDCTEKGIAYHIHSEGCGDPGIKPLTCGMSTITVNGVDHSKHGRGINFVAVDATNGNVRSSQSFDWHGDYQGCSKSLSWLRQWPDQTIIFGAYQDEASYHFIGGVCDKALELIGGKRPFQTEYRASFAIVGYIGKESVAWIQQKKSLYGRGPTDLKGNIKLIPVYLQYDIHSEGCGDPGINPLTCGMSTITVGGKDYSQHGRGINFVAFDAKTGKLFGSTSFDWHGDSSGCSKAMAWLNKVPDHSIVLGAYQDEGSRSFINGLCDKALELIGGKRPFQTEYRASFAIVGYKGKGSVAWLRQKKSGYGKGPTDLKGSIPFL